MPNAHDILIAVGCICEFAASIFDVPKVNLIALGLFFFMLSFLMHV